jgi:hypothetical protein
MNPCSPEPPSAGVEATVDVVLPDAYFHHPPMRN